MSLLYDDLVHGFETDDLGDMVQRDVRHELKRAFIINIQNVSEYLIGGGKNMWSYEDFPNIAPPFPDMWMEFSVPDVTFGAGKKHTMGALMLAVDLNAQDLDTRKELLSGFNMSALEQMFALGEADAIAHGADPQKTNGKIRWLYRMRLYKRFPNGEIMEMGIAFVLISDRGQVLSPTKHVRYDPSSKFLSILKEVAAREGHDERNLTMNAMKAVCFPIWLALTFMNCKGVATERVAPVPEKLQKSRQSKGKGRLHRAHVIVIDPMRRVIKAGTGENHYSAKALHIVRGHFREYDEKPLFGKYRGLFWVPMHTAGNVGEVQRNPYSVKSPTEAA